MEISKLIQINVHAFKKNYKNSNPCQFSYHLIHNNCCLYEQWTEYFKTKWISIGVIIRIDCFVSFCSSNFSHLMDYFYSLIFFSIIYSGMNNIFRHSYINRSTCVNKTLFLLNRQFNIILSSPMKGKFRCFNVQYCSIFWEDLNFFQLWSDAFIHGK